MVLKAKLKIQLLAGDNVIAEIEDNDDLWQKILRVGTTGESLETPIDRGPSGGAEARGSEREKSNGGDSPLGAFANELQIDISELEAGCDPSSEEPYLHLDHHCWEALKKNTPKRGAGSIPPIVLAGTIICLWAKQAGMPNPSISMAQRVLNTIDIADKNPTRGLRGCDWLQNRGGTLNINPSAISSAVKLTRAYCLKTPVGGDPV